MKPASKDTQPRRTSGHFAARAKTSLAGLTAGVRSDRSIRELWMAAIGGWIALCVASPAPAWWALALLAGSLAISIEYLNAALEAALDELHPADHPVIGMAKDLASAAAFVTNLTALGVLAFAIASA